MNNERKSFEEIIIELLQDIGTVLRAANEINEDILKERKESNRLLGQIGDSCENIRL